MRTYIKPEVQFVDLSTEERFAGSVCIKAGVCHWTLKDGTVFWPYEGNEG